MTISLGGIVLQLWFQWQELWPTIGVTGLASVGGIVAQGWIKASKGPHSAHRAVCRPLVQQDKYRQWMHGCMVAPQDAAREGRHPETYLRKKIKIKDKEAACSICDQPQTFIKKKNNTGGFKITLMTVWPTSEVGHWYSWWLVPKIPSFVWINLLR